MKNLRMVRTAGLVILIIAFGVLAACKGKSKASLTLTKDSFQPGEPVVVKYTALPEYDSSAWIGIIPSKVPHGSEAENDRHDLTYKYLRKSTSGEFTFTAPGEAGFYDFRMHNTDSGGMEVASVSFKVVGATQPAQLAQVTSKSKFKVGDSCMVEWKGSWWPARIIELRKGEAPYKIHYDGYSNSWDEWIGAGRIRVKQ